MPRRVRQLALFAPEKKATKRGRKPHPDRIGFVPHTKRPVHEWRHPVHVTMRAVRLAPSFRSERIYNVIVRKFVALKSRGVRVVDYSVQADHLHLMVEAHDRVALSRKMQLLFSRIALAVNRIAKRRGSLFRDRHHRVELASPSQVRNALVYILFNERKHAAAHGPLSAADLGSLDAMSSAPWFTGWHENARPPPTLVAQCQAVAMAESTERPTSEPRTWFARAGWRRGGGAIRFDELPRAAR